MGSSVRGDREPDSMLLLEAEIANLRRAIETRDVIGQAKGILMERFRLTADQAFALLARSSQRRNVKLAALAANLAETGAWEDPPDDAGTAAVSDLSAAPSS